MASVLSSLSLFSTSVAKVRGAKGDRNTQVLSPDCETAGYFDPQSNGSHHSLPFTAPVLQMSKLRLEEVVTQPRSHSLAKRPRQNWNLFPQQGPLPSCHGPIDIIHG